MYCSTLCGKMVLVTSCRQLAELTNILNKARPREYFLRNYNWNHPFYGSFNYTEQCLLKIFFLFWPPSSRFFASKFFCVKRCFCRHTSVSERISVSTHVWYRSGTRGGGEPKLRLPNDGYRGFAKLNCELN